MPKIADIGLPGRAARTNISPSGLFSIAILSPACTPRGLIKSLRIVTCPLDVTVRNSYRLTAL
jgi:hypothetical protein